MSTNAPTVKAFLSTVLLTSAVLTGAIALARHVGWLEGMELGAYDRFVQSRAPEKLDDRILVVGISEADIQSSQEYPIHDGTLAAVLSKLEAQQPAAIGLDIGRDVPQGPDKGRQQLLKLIRESDRVFPVCKLSSADEPGVPAPPGTPSERVAAADFPGDNGEVVRRSILLATPPKPPAGTLKTHLCNDPNPESEIPSLGFTLALSYLAERGVEVQPRSDGGLQLGKLAIHRLGAATGGYAKTDTGDFQIMLNYRANRGAIRVVDATTVLSDQLDPNWVQGRVVLIGYTSTVANDMLVTPYIETEKGVRSMPGVLVHAQATSQLLAGALDQRPLITTWPRAVDGLWIGLWTLVGGSVAFVGRRLLWLSLGTVVAGGACVGVCWLLFSGSGLWVPLVPSLLGLVGSVIATRTLSSASESGYAQAIAEDLLAQVRRRNQATDEEQDWLQRLTRRAQAIREGKTEEEILLEKLTVAGAGSGSVYDQAREHIKSDLYDELYGEIEKEVRSKIKREQQGQQVSRLLQRAEALRED
jgi:adenylate cyclase